MTVMTLVDRKRRETPISAPESVGKPRRKRNVGVCATAAISRWLGAQPQQARSVSSIRTLSHDDILQMCKMGKQQVAFVYHIRDTWTNADLYEVFGRFFVSLETGG